MIDSCAGKQALNGSEGGQNETWNRVLFMTKASVGPGWLVGWILQRRQDEFHYVGMENGPRITLDFGLMEYILWAAFLGIPLLFSGFSLLDFAVSCRGFVEGVYSSSSLTASPPLKFILTLYNFPAISLSIAHHPRWNLIILTLNKILQ